AGCRALSPAPAVRLPAPRGGRSAPARLPGAGVVRAPPGDGAGGGSGAGNDPTGRQTQTHYRGTGRNTPDPRAIAAALPLGERLLPAPGGRHPRHHPAHPAAPGGAASHHRGRALAPDSPRPRPAGQRPVPRPETAPAAATARPGTPDHGRHRRRRSQPRDCSRPAKQGPGGAIRRGAGRATAALGDALAESPLALRREQQAVLDAIAIEGFNGYLLQGETGSGKTEIYLQAIARVLRQGRQALVLIPEISLTPQTVGRFRRRFGDDVAVLHSGLTDRERLLAWQAAREGRARILIGTRSAVFTPLANPG